MQRLPEVEEAKALLAAAMDWSIWRWMTDKALVRRTVDRGTAALDELDRRAKASWSDALKKAYSETESQAALDNDPAAKRPHGKAKTAARDVDQKTKAAARRVREADREAYRARMDAEQTFDEAERRLNAGLAREGSRKALAAFDLREQAIRQAEAAARAG